MPRRARLDAPGTLHHVIVRGIDKFIAQIGSSEKVTIAELRAGSRRKKVSGVRARIAIGLVKKHGVALAEVARRVGVSTSAISKVLKRAAY